jgi:hypothetical protein
MHQARGAWEGTDVRIVLKRVGRWICYPARNGGRTQRAPYGDRGPRLPLPTESKTAGPGPRRIIGRVCGGAREALSSQYGMSVGYRLDPGWLCRNHRRAVQRVESSRPDVGPWRRTEFRESVWTVTTAGAGSVGGRRSPAGSRRSYRIDPARTVVSTPIPVPAHAYVRARAAGDTLRAADDDGRRHQSAYGVAHRRGSGPAISVGKTAQPARLRRIVSRWGPQIIVRTRSTGSMRMTNGVTGGRMGNDSRRGGQGRGGNGSAGLGGGDLWIHRPRSRPAASLADERRGARSRPGSAPAGRRFVHQSGNRISGDRALPRRRPTSEASRSRTDGSLRVDGTGAGRRDDVTPDTAVPCRTASPRRNGELWLIRCRCRAARSGSRLELAFSAWLSRCAAPASVCGTVLAPGDEAYICSSSALVHRLRGRARVCVPNCGGELVAPPAAGCRVSRRGRSLGCAHARSGATAACVAGRAARRPGRGGDQRGLLTRGRASRPGEIEDVLLRLREPGGRGQPQRRPDGGAARGLPESVAGVTVNRLCASGCRRSSAPATRSPPATATSSSRAGSSR